MEELRKRTFFGGGYNFNYYPKVGINWVDQGTDQFGLQIRKR